jgi:5-(carboxyamino)imidazole ribonucleotide synthase
MLGITLGIVGGGQLAAMTCVEARRLGHRVLVIDPDPACPAAALASELIVAEMGDTAALRDLAERSDVITVDTEHVPAEALAVAAARVPVHPRPEFLGIVQDRSRQRAFLAQHAFPQPTNVIVRERAELEAALGAVGGEGILKSSRGGYDGRGQVRIRRGSDLDAAWASIGARTGVLEAVVPFVRELSVVLARNAEGQIASYPVIESVQRRHILHVARAPAPLPEATARAARDLAERLVNLIDYVGVLALELFLLPDGGLYVNEIAPRVHNTGHLTFGGAYTSQFEQLVRALTGSPLGSPELVAPALIVNILGDVWNAGEPDFSPVLAHPRARLELYGKAVARPGRKMGHFLMLGDVSDAGVAEAERVLASIGPARKN